MVVTNLTRIGIKPCLRQLVFYCFIFSWTSAGAQSFDQEATIDPGTGHRLWQADYEIPEARLLDVSIRIFEPGLAKKNPSAKENKGVFADVRHFESRFIPLRLMETLQTTGYWGAVRVVPGGSSQGEVIISGKILKSTGVKLALSIHVSDATGRKWFQRKYKQESDHRSYRDRATGPMAGQPFQKLYNQIANDLLKIRRRIATRDIGKIRQVSSLKFAHDLVPDAFGDYLKVKRKKKRFAVKKLPAQDDPMMSRVALIRDRDRMFLDTLTEHYLNFGARLDEAYKNWRKASYEEQMALREIRRKARAQKILGILMIAGAVLADGNSNSSRAAQQAAVIGGQMVLSEGINKGQEAKIHREALKELAQSFDAEVAPLLIELEGNTHRLTGSAEDQYGQWRDILRAIFHAESGLPIDPNDEVADLQVNEEN